VAFLQPSNKNKKRKHPIKPIKNKTKKAIKIKAM
jgi:hypothetical protein